MTTVAIIPARKNSKGIACKNKKMLSGRPLIQWTIDAAKTAKSLDYIFVTTDDLDIYRLALECGVNAIDRYPELGQDHIQLDEVLVAALRVIEYHHAIQPDTLVFLAPTSPFRTAQHIDEAVERFHAIGRKGTVISVVRDPKWHWEIGVPSFRMMPVHQDPTRRLGRQWVGEYDSLFYETGAIYVVDAEAFSQWRCQRIPPYTAYVVDDDIELDTEMDWARAEQRARQRLADENRTPESSEEPHCSKRTPE